MEHNYYSIRNGKNENLDGLPLPDILELFSKIYYQLESNGYFDEYFGSYCVENGFKPGKVQDIETEIILKIRKKNLWPIDQYSPSYSEDDFLDIIEFLYQNISKPTKGSMHSWSNCGMHWEEFNKEDGQRFFIEKINRLLSIYKNKFELSKNGEVLIKPQDGFEKIFEADIPSDDINIIERINSATRNFRRHGSTPDDRRQAVRDLADVLEYLK